MNPLEGGGDPKGNPFERFFKRRQERQRKNALRELLQTNDQVTIDAFKDVYKDKLLHYLIESHKESFDSKYTSPGGRIVELTNKLDEVIRTVGERVEKELLYREAREKVEKVFLLYSENQDPTIAAQTPLVQKKAVLDAIDRVARPILGYHPRSLIK